MANSPITSGKPRTKKAPKYSAFKVSRKINPSAVKKLPSIRELWQDTRQFIWKHKAKFVGFWLLYTLVYLVVVRGAIGFDLDTGVFRDELNILLDGNFGALLSLVVVYVTLLTSLTFSNNESNYFQFTTIIIFSLAFIWLLRKLHSKNQNPSIKEAMYMGMRPLIPFLGVVTLLSLELAPAALGGLLLTTVDTASPVSESAETLALGMVALMTVLISVYLFTGSVFALYISTLPNTGPFVAIRASMRLLRLHRWVVARKILGFVGLLILASFVLMLPVLMWVTRYAEPVLYVLSCGMFGVFHVYMYKLYRSML